MRYRLLVVLGSCICLGWLFGASCRPKVGVTSAASSCTISPCIAGLLGESTVSSDGSSRGSTGRIYSPATQSAEPGVAMDVPILMYHYLTSADSPPTQYHVTQGLFAQQMEALDAYGYTTVSLVDFVDYRSGVASPPDRPVILTFDDGHRSVYTLARPILEARAMQATLFVVTEAAAESEGDRNGDWLVWDPELNALYAGGFPIESHSVTHPRLTDIPLDQAAQELLNSRLDIESHLSNQVRFFCYPGGIGAYEPEIRTLVQQAGYWAAVAAGPGGVANTATSDIWALPRVAISESHSVELDPIHPEDFFMRRLDPAFPLPLITVDTVRFGQADGTSGACFSPGEIVSVTVVATNDGAAVDAQLTFTLGDSTHDPYYSQVIAVHLDPEVTETVVLLASLADDLILGQHAYNVRFEDAYSVLGFMASGWQPAFRLAATCYRSYVPVVLRKTVAISPRVQAGLSSPLRR